jgi:hypothetical protein
MPKHEPEVLAAVRRRKRLNSRIVSDDSFPGASRDHQVLCCPRCGYSGESASGQSEQRPHTVYRLSRFLVACIRSLLYK